MPRFLVSVSLLFVAAVAVTVAVPLPSQTSSLDRSAGSSQSAESDENEAGDGSIVHQISDRSRVSISISEEDNESGLKDEVDEDNSSDPRSAEEDASKKLVKRDIPDPEPCGCRHDADPEREYGKPTDDDLYLQYNNPHKRDRRQVEDAKDADRSEDEEKVEPEEMNDEEASDEEADDEDSSEKIWKPDVKKTKDEDDADGRRRHHLDGDNTSEEKSSEEQAKAEDNEIDSGPLKAEENRPNAKLSMDYSMEDYAQGCEETEVNSDEANETTYDESRRKRDAAKAANDEDDDESPEEIKNHEEVEKFALDGRSSEEEKVSKEKSSEEKSSEEKSSEENRQAANMNEKQNDRFPTEIGRNSGDGDSAESKQSEEGDESKENNDSVATESFKLHHEEKSEMSDEEEGKQSSEELKESAESSEK